MDAQIGTGPAGPAVGGPDEGAPDEPIGGRVDGDAAGGFGVTRPPGG